MNRKNFLICGLTGWCLEIIFTSLGCACAKDLRLTGRTSIWMFPIYGMAALICPVYQKIRSWPTLLRGVLYSLGIMTGEYVSGTLLKRRHLCPWDYSSAKTNINGVVRLDYFPLWLLAGLVFERILCGQGRKDEKTPS